MVEGDSLTELQKLTEKLEELIQTNRTILNEVSPAVLPKTYQEVLPPAAIGDQFRAIAKLRAPYTKYFEITNNSVNLLEVQFLKDDQSQQLVVLQPFTTRRYDMRVEYVYARPRPPTVVATQTIVDEFLTAGSPEDKQTRTAREKGSYTLRRGRPRWELGKKKEGEEQQTGTLRIPQVAR